jgi:peptidoglycan/xylan/chitin deacetylase (PgdA/CDA1 family)
MLKQIVKVAAFRFGAFSLLQRLRNRGCLTVLMFHRVLPQNEAARLGADPLYTLTPSLFEVVLDFVKRHYTPVDIESVLAARAGKKPLPLDAALITFDDGWHDNYEHALPILARAGIPWILFANTDAVAAPACWWQEVLLWTLRTKAATFDDLWSRADGEGETTPPPQTHEPGFALLLRYGKISADRREELLRPYAAAFQNVYRGNVALSAAELRAMREKGIAVGAHGSSHLPLSLMDDAASDIAAAKDWLTKNVDASTERSMSFPHGRYDSRALGAARQAGYRLLFTSDPILNECPGGWLSGDLLGRISVSADNIAGASGRLRGEQLSASLFLRERRALTQKAER